MQMKRKIKLFDPVITGREETYLKKVLKSRFWASGAGIGYVAQFEKKFQKYVGSKECICVNSGTAALHLALSSLDLKGKEVILPSLSFVSTAHAVLYNGGKPVFVDVNPKTLCLEPELVEKKINSKTAVILPVHFAGMPAELDRFKKMTNDWKITLIEDAAHACGSTFNKKRIGSHGDLVCFSFHPVKNLAMPSGGLISMNNSDFRKLKNDFNAKRWCGITNRKNSFYNVKEIGWNFYLNEFSAAIGLAQLRKLDTLNEKRKQIARRYSTEINLDHKMPFDPNCCYHFYWIIAKNRNKLRKKLEKAGIETGIHYIPIHKFSMYKKQATKLPTTEKLSDSIITIPTHPNLSDEDIHRIIKSINEYA